MIIINVLWLASYVYCILYIINYYVKSLRNIFLRILYTYYIGIINRQCGSMNKKHTYFIIFVVNNRIVNFIRIVALPIAGEGQYPNFIPVLIGHIIFILRLSV